MAQLPEGHPDLLTSVKDFLEDPAGTIELHLDKSSS